MLYGYIFRNKSQSTGHKLTDIQATEGVRKLAKKRLWLLLKGEQQLSFPDFFKYPLKLCLTALH